MAFSSGVSSRSRDWVKYLKSSFVFILPCLAFIFPVLISEALNLSVTRTSGFTSLNTSAV